MKKGAREDVRKFQKLLPPQSNVEKLSEHPNTQNIKPALEGGKNQLLIVHLRRRCGGQGGGHFGG